MKDPLAELRRTAPRRRRTDCAGGCRTAADPNLESRSDILSMLVAARFEDGEPMGDSELRDQLMTLLLAGHETTATALAWTFDLLLRNPEQFAAFATRSGRATTTLPAGDDHRGAAAAAGGPARRAPTRPSARVDGRELPPGTDVAPAIWLTHTRPEIYPDPLAFRPERFLEDGARDVLVDPVRRRCPPLPRRGLRRVRDAGGAARGARSLRARGRPLATRADHPAQRHLLPQARHPGATSLEAQRQAGANSGSGLRRAALSPRPRRPRSARRSRCRG